MVVVLRLQGLRISAGSEDIRRFFTGLEIPAGGVHIIGGEHGDAFIIFSLDEDARRAMVRSGGQIKGSTITLQLSSKAELQKELERSTETMALDQKRSPVDTAKHAERPEEPMLNMRFGSKSGYTSPPRDSKMDDSVLPHSICLFLKGLPYAVKETQIFDFFSGLHIDDLVLMKKRDGTKNGTALVKFATTQDASEGLKRDKEYIGTRYIDVSRISTNEWYQYSGRGQSMPDINDRFDRGRAPAQSPKIAQQRERSRSPLAQTYTVPVNKEYFILLENLSFGVEIGHIRQLFHHANLEEDQIMHLQDRSGQRTRSLLILFRNPQDFADALNQDKIEFHNRLVSIRPISREEMSTLVESQYMGGTDEKIQNQPDGHSSDPRNSENICVYVENLPYDVRKVEIIDFFYGFNVSEDEVCVLHDQRGSGIGKALVLFKSETEAMRVLSLNERRFLGSVVYLKIISRSHMQQLMDDPPMRQDLLPAEAPYAGRGSMAPFPGDNGNSGSRFSEDMSMGQPFTPRFSDDMSMRQVSRFSEDMSMGQASRSSFSEDMSMGQARDSSRRAFEDDFNTVDTYGRVDRGNGVCKPFEAPERHFENPTTVQLVNLPFQVRCQEIYDFCHGYRVVPGSVCLQYDRSGRPRGSAMVEFESREEAMAAISELSGRPIGKRKIQFIL